MNKYFQGELLENPITTKEWKLRWSRENKDKIKQYQNMEYECPYCNKNIKVGKKFQHRDSKRCCQRQKEYLRDLILENNLFTLNYYNFLDMMSYLEDELRKVKKDKEKFEERLIEHISYCENIKNKILD